jgi:DNA transformation protein and related proteins
MKKENAKIRNIGPVSRRWLASIDVFSLEDLRTLGIDQTMLKLVLNGANPSLNFAYALQGALLDCHWLEIPPDIKADLQRKFKK